METWDELCTTRQRTQEQTITAATNTDVLEVGLLECDHVLDELHAVEGDYSDMFRGLLAGTPHIKLVTYDVVGGELPDDPGQHAAWMITGARYSVFDDLPWIRDLLQFIRNAQDTHTRMVGVCFGHQAIAHALGGETRRWERGWGVGVHALDVVEHRPWMQPQQDHLRMIMSHQDQVVALPPGAQILAQTEHCGIAMFEVGDRMLGLQGHPEYSTKYAAAALETRLDLIPAELVVAARATWSDETDAAAASEWIARFLSEARS